MSLVQCMKILCDNGKTNQTGKVEEQGAIRHRLVELCAIGSLALHFFVQFQILDDTSYNWLPDFSSNSQEAGYGMYGYREWHQYKVFPGEDRTKQMTYKSISLYVYFFKKTNEL